MSLYTTHTVVFDHDGDQVTVVAPLYLDDDRGIEVLVNGVDVTESIDDDLRRIAQRRADDAWERAAEDARQLAWDDA